MGFIGNYLRNLCKVWVGREPVHPLMFSYYITHRYDLNCRYCSDGDGKRFKEDPIPELGTREAKQLLSILRKAGDTLDITGTERLDEPLGNILTDDIHSIRKRLWHAADNQQCSQCWTSCRGFAESMFKPPRLRQYREFLHSVKPH